MSDPRVRAIGIARFRPEDHRIGHQPFIDGLDLDKRHQNGTKAPVRFTVS